MVPRSPWPGHSGSGRSALRSLASDPVRAQSNPRRSAALASASGDHPPTRAFVSALVRSDLLPLSPVSARRSGEINARDSKIAIPHQISLGSAPVMPWFFSFRRLPISSASASVMGFSRPPESISMDAPNPRESKRMGTSRMSVDDVHPAALELP